MERFIPYTVPYIDISNSDTFKKQAENIVKELPKQIEINGKMYPKWMSYLSLPENLGESVFDNFDIYQQSIWSFEMNIKRSGSSVQLLTELFKHITIITNKDLVEQLKKATVYLNKSNNFTGVLEYGSDDYKPNSIKSKDWMMNEATKYINIVNFKNYQSIKTNGNYVIIDDAVYSGAQLLFEVNMILKNTKSSVIYLLIMFSTQFGISFIEKNINFDSKNETDECFTYIIGNHTLHLWKGFKLIQSVPSLLEELNNNPEMNDYIYRTLLTGGATITIFEHKLADYKSLVWVIANVFYMSLPEHYINMPPYQPKLVGFGNVNSIQSDINYLLNLKCS